MSSNKQTPNGRRGIGVEVIDRTGLANIQTFDTATQLPKVVLIRVPANKASGNGRIWDNDSVAKGLAITNELIKQGKTFEVYLGHHMEAQREGILPAGKILPNCRTLPDGTAYIPVELIYELNNPMHPGLVVAQRIKAGQIVEASMVAYLDCENPRDLTGYCSVERDKPIGIDFLSSDEDPGIKGTQVVAVVEKDCKCNGRCKSCKVNNLTNQNKQLALEVESVVTMDEATAAQIMSTANNPEALQAMLNGMVAANKQKMPSQPSMPSPLIPLITEGVNDPMAPAGSEGNDQTTMPAGEGVDPMAPAGSEGNDQTTMPAGEGVDPTAPAGSEGNDQTTMPAGEGVDQTPKPTASESVKINQTAKAQQPPNKSTGLESRLQETAILNAMAKTAGMTPQALTNALRAVQRKVSTEQLTNDLRKVLNTKITAGETFAGINLKDFSILDLSVATKNAATETMQTADGNPLYAENLLKLKLKEMKIDKDREAASENARQSILKGRFLPNYNTVGTNQGYRKTVDRYRQAYAQKNGISQAAQEKMSKDPRFLKYQDSYRTVFERQYGPALERMGLYADSPTEANRRAATESLGQVGVREIANLPELMQGFIEQSFFTSPALRLVAPYPIGGNPETVRPSGLNVQSLDGKSGEFVFITHQTYTQPLEVSSLRDRGNFNATPKISSYQNVTQHFVSYDEVTTSISYHILDQMLRNPYQQDVLSQVERSFMSYYVKTREMDIMNKIVQSCLEYGALQVASPASPEVVSNVSTHWAFSNTGVVSYSGYTVYGKAAVGLRGGDAANVANQTRRLVVPPRLSRVNINGALSLAVAYPIIAEVTVGGTAVIHKVGYLDSNGRVRAANPQDGNPETEPFIGVTNDGVVVFSNGSNITQNALENGGVRFLGYHLARNVAPLVVRDANVPAKELGTRIIRDIMTTRSAIMTKRNAPPPDFFVCGDPVINTLSFAEATTGDTQVNFAAVQAALGADNWAASQIMVRGLGFESSSEKMFASEKLAVMSAVGLVIDYPVTMPIATRGLARNGDGNVIGAEDMVWRWSNLTTPVPQIGLIDDNPTGEPIFGITNFPGIVFHIPEPTVTQPIIA
jgi:hypothetical protein